MNPTAKVIERQLANESVYMYTLWGTHFVDLGTRKGQNCLGSDRDQAKAVEDAIKTTLRIGGLLAKYHDSLTSKDPAPVAARKAQLAKWQLECEPTGLFSL